MKRLIFLISFSVLALTFNLQGFQELNVYAAFYDIKADSNNRVHIIWKQNNYLYYGQIENNAVVNQETTPAVGVTTNKFRPRIAVNPDGSEVHFVWINKNIRAKNIHHCWRDANGNWHQEIAYTAVNYVAYPTIAFDAAGVGHLAASAYQPNSRIMPVIYSRKSGGSWQKYSNLSPSDNKYTSVDMFVDHSGGVHVVWIRDAEYIQYRYTPSGGSLSSSPTINLPSSSYGAEHADIFVDKENNVHVASLSYKPPAATNNVVEYWTKPTGSSSFSTPVIASVNNFSVLWGYITHPVVAAASANVAVTSWAIESSDGYVNKIYVSAKIDGVWTPYLLDDDAYFSSMQCKPALAVNDTTGFLIWRGANGKLRLETYEYGDIDPTITVTSPNGGEVWEVNSTRNITWSTTGTVENVKIEYSTNNGSNWTNIASSTTNDGSYSWKVPNTTSSQCLVRIKEASDGDPSDISDSTFSIVPAGTVTQLSLSRTQFYFGYVQGGNTPQSQSFFVSNTGSGTSNWSVSSSAGWLNCSPSSGTNSGEVTISINPSGLTPGTYTGSVSVSDPNATNSPQVVSVTLKVYNPGGSGTPFGFFATPIDGATVSSSVPVTGWALDDVGIESVNIFRKEGGAYVYIGGAIFVDGARPDVEQAYPGYPMNYQAGWGYMMLTNFLPNGGNGTFTLYAIATDKDGHQTTLGTKTITCDNANAVKPFGAIDTPAQGGTASEIDFINHGWVLTPMPNSIPTNGSTINVIIDGVNLGHPTYNTYRTDIAELFPGYANSGGAAGHFLIDTTAYANGVHTIAWTAADNAGNSDGIGSRYFTIRNLGASSGVSGQGSVVSGQGSGVRGKHTLSKIPLDVSSPVEVIKGYNRNVVPLNNDPDENGIITIEIKELECFEIRLFPVGSREETRLAPLYTGYQVVGPQLRPFPIGSFLDREKGIFYWQPGPGFTGEYRLVFVEKWHNEEIRKREMLIRIVPKFQKEE